MTAPSAPRDYLDQAAQAGIRTAPDGYVIPAGDAAEYASPERSKIEMFGDGSPAAFWSARVDAWHKLGTVTPEGADAAEAIRLARLDWEVTKHPAWTTVELPARITDDGVSEARKETLGMPGRYATVRVNPATDAIEVLGDVGEDYTPIQNLECAEALNTIAQVTGAHFETAGALYQGRKMFVSMRLPTEIRIGGHDQVDMFLVAQNSHDGGSAFNVSVTPIRPVCRNTCRLGRAHAVSQVSIRHTSGAKNLIADAQEVLGISNTFMDEFQALTDHLYDTPMSRTEFGDFVDELYQPTFETKGKAAGQETRGTQVRREALFGLWQSGTQEGIRGTAWGAYNVVTEYQDWVLPISSRAGDLARVERIGRGGVDAPKVRALALLTR